MESSERKAYRREWAKRKYRADPEKARDDSRRRRAAETPEQRAERLAKGRAYRQANLEKLRAANSLWRANNKNRTRDNNLRRIGWSAALFDECMSAQQGACAICYVDLSQLPPKQVHADHCHTTNTPRGVLCGSCNSGLGFFYDSPDRLEAAVAYVKKWKM